MKLGLKFTFLLFLAFVVVMVATGSLQKHRLRRQAKRFFIEESVKTAAEIEAAAPLFFRPSGRPHLKLMLAFARKHLKAARVTIIDIQGKLIAESRQARVPAYSPVEFAVKEPGNLIFSKILRHDSTFLGKLIIEMDPSQERQDEILRQSRLTVGTLAIALFTAWVLAEIILELIIVRPIKRMLCGLQNINRRSSISVDELRGMLSVSSRDELEEMSHTLADIIERAGADRNYIPKTGSSPSAKADNPLVHDLDKAHVR